MKTKLMKKMIALICAAAMTTSCATVSVGALRAKPGASAAITNKVDELRKRLDEYRMCLGRIGDIYEEYKNYKDNASNIVKPISDQIKDAPHGGISIIGEIYDVCYYGVVAGDENTVKYIEQKINEMQPLMNDLIAKYYNIFIDDAHDRVFYIINNTTDERIEILNADYVANLFRDTVNKLRQKVHEIYSGVEISEEYLWSSNLSNAFKN